MKRKHIFLVRSDINCVTFFSRKKAEEYLKFLDGMYVDIHGNETFFNYRNGLLYYNKKYVNLELVEEFTII